MLKSRNRKGVSAGHTCELGERSSVRFLGGVTELLFLRSGKRLRWCSSLGDFVIGGYSREVGPGSVLRRELEMRICESKPKELSRSFTVK